MEMIKPKLKNWDADRIAVLDMIMIRMGVCELLFFETIPNTKPVNHKLICLCICQRAFWFLPSSIKFQDWVPCFFLSNIKPIQLFLNNVFYPR
jgi:hypothetical protein